MRPAQDVRLLRDERRVVLARDVPGLLEVLLNLERLGEIREGLHLLRSDYLLRVVVLQADLLLRLGVRGRVVVVGRRRAQWVSQILPNRALRWQVDRVLLLLREVLRNLARSELAAKLTKWDWV